MDLPRANKPHPKPPRVPYSSRWRPIFWDGPWHTLILDLGWSIGVPRIDLRLGGSAGGVAFGKCARQVSSVFHVELLLDGREVDGRLVRHVVEPPVPFGWDLRGVTLEYHPVGLVILDPTVPSRRVGGQDILRKVVWEI